MSATIKMVDAKTLGDWIAIETALVIDVREPDEHRAGHIPGAILNSLSSFDPARIPDPAGKHLVLHCQLGRRCGPASEKLVAAGYSGIVYRLAGGFAAWTATGGTVTR